MTTGRLLDVAPRDDLAALASDFARHRRVQIRDVLTKESADLLHKLLARDTPWGIAWQAGGSGARFERSDALRQMTPEQHQARASAIGASMASDEYGFNYCAYPMVMAYGKWAPNGPHDMLLEYINDRPFMDLVRAITGEDDIVKADAQATLYTPGQFLAMHDDRDNDAGRRIAYVLSLCGPGWRPEWGGYLQFYDDEGDVIAGYRPRFNALNLFAVPQRHDVTPVAAYAPLGRFAVTGWFRDR